MAFLMFTPENKNMSLKYKSTITKKEEEKLKRQFTKGLAKHLKRIRKQKGLSQEELAFRAGLNSAYIGHLERGIYSPTLYVIWKISQALDVSLREFLSDFQ